MLLFIIFVQLLLVIIKLLNLMIKSLDLNHLCSQHLLVILLQLEIIHFGVTHVTDSVHFWVTPRQTTTSLTADLANALTTAFAMSYWILTNSACE